MLGIFLIVCMAVYFFIRFKAYCLLREDFVEQVELDSVGREYEFCHHAAVLRGIGLLLILVGYSGCAWPFLFIEGIDTIVYVYGIVLLLAFPVFFISSICYLTIRNGQGAIRISTDEIEYKAHKSFTVKVGDIKKISNRCLWGYEIYLKEKGKKTLYFDVHGFYKRKELCSLIAQFRDHSAKLSGRDKKLVHKLSPWKFDAILNRYFLVICEVVIGIALLYSSYCCIDYDFFRKDYTAELNALGVVQGEAENAWEHYVQAAVNYKKMEGNFQEVVTDSLKSGELDFTDEQIGKLRKWYDENLASWEYLKKAASIGYCNAVYESISVVDSKRRNDFSNPSDNGYSQIRGLYRNINACRLLGVIDLDWWDLFEMQLASTKHFVDDKTFIDQLVGYTMVRRSVKLLADRNGYEFEDLEKVRGLLREYFPDGVPELSVEGEILEFCSLYKDMINLIKIPVQTPLNPSFMMAGSISGAEALVRERFAESLKQVRNGIEPEEEKLSSISFPMLRGKYLNLFSGSFAGVYKISRKAETNLLVGYFLLDLEEYRLVKGEYPADVLGLRRAGFDSLLPGDVDSGGKVIYLNDGQWAVLYAVGKNGKDDGGYRDDKDAETKRDDVVYWERDLEEDKLPQTL